MKKVQTTKVDFKLDGHEYIELNNVLKVLSLVNSGGEAKVLINNGQAEVNGETEYRKRKKLRAGDVVVFNNNEITISV